MSRNMRRVGDRRCSFFAGDDEGCCPCAFWDSWDTNFSCDIRFVIFLTPLGKNGVLCDPINSPLESYDISSVASIVGYCLVVNVYGSIKNGTLTGAVFY